MQCLCVPAGCAAAEFRVDPSSQRQEVILFILESPFPSRARGFPWGLVPLDVLGKDEEVFALISRACPALTQDVFPSST